VTVMPLSNNFLYKPLCKTVSKTFVASSKVQYTFDPLVIYLMDSLTVNRACVQLLFFLKPNCSGSLVMNSPYKHNRADSNSFDIAGDKVIPRYIFNISCITMLAFKQRDYNTVTKVTWNKTVIYHRIE